MITRLLTAGLAAVLMLSIGVVGCGKKEEPKPAVQAAAPIPVPPPVASVASVTLAKGVDISWTAVSPATEFKPKDRINLLVKTEHATPGSMLSVTWFFLGTNQVVKTDSVSLKENGANSSAFFIERAKGWPAGDYRVDVTLAGKLEKSAMFKVAN